MFIADLLDFGLSAYVEFDKSAFDEELAIKILKSSCFLEYHRGGDDVLKKFDEDFPELDFSYSISDDKSTFFLYLPKFEFKVMVTFLLECRADLKTLAIMVFLICVMSEMMLRNKIPFRVIGHNRSSDGNHLPDWIASAYDLEESFESYLEYKGETRKIETNGREKKFFFLLELPDVLQKIDSLSDDWNKTSLKLNMFDNDTVVHFGVSLYIETIEQVFCSLKVHSPMSSEIFENEYLREDRVDLVLNQFMISRGYKNSDDNFGSKSLFFSFLGMNASLRLWFLLYAFGGFRFYDGIDYGLKYESLFCKQPREFMKKGRVDSTVEVLGRRDAVGCG